MRLNDFQFNLPPELIARYPLAKRSASRLLCINQSTAEIIHRPFSDMIDLVALGYLLVFNNT
jgi:S-adenosylmethionine:tRNA ribosyltransferase-isomerase